VSQKNHLQVKTDLNALSQVLSWFNQLNQAKVYEKIWLQCQLALAEGFTNAVRHAHKDQPPDMPIEIEVTLLTDGLEIRIWDYGAPFDLVQKSKMLPAKIDNDQEGGRGLKLMLQIADQLSYIRTPDHRNCLLITKHNPNF
jgi:serine/threonine-protein kinase RsbW